MFLGLELNVDGGKKVSKEEILYWILSWFTGPIFLFQLQSTEAAFEAEQRTTFDKGFVDVCSVMQPLLGQVVARVKWLNVLQMVKPENEFSQFSLCLGPSCAGNRNPDL